jgi:hypothetical protein
MENGLGGKGDSDEESEDWMKTVQGLGFRQTTPNQTAPNSGFV